MKDSPMKAPAPFQALRDALAAGPTSAWDTHPRDTNLWKENERYAHACDPSTIRALLDRLHLLEKMMEQWASECADCGGKGYTTTIYGGSGWGSGGPNSCVEHEPCPECADIRALLPSAPSIPTTEEKS